MTTRVTFIDRAPRSGFLEADLACVERRFEVDRVIYGGRNTLGYVLRCARAALRTSAVYVFFGSEHALVPAALFRLLGRRVVLVQGGYDYADLPDRGYGLAARGRGWLPRAVGRLCTASLAISRQSRAEFLALVPTAGPKTSLAYLAVDVDRWPDPHVVRDPERVVTVGYIDDEAFSRKGIDRFVEAARRDPTRAYVLAGRVVPSVLERIERARPSNLELVGSLPQDELARLFWSSGVYAQLSWHETFGMAMAEAMACGCVPVIGDSMALREVAGRWAHQAGPGGSADHDVEAIAAAAKTAQGVEPGAIRRDIAARFPVATREVALARALAGGVP